MRATVDLDNPSIALVVAAWDTLADYGDGRVYGRVSSSGTGVHLKVHGCDEATATALRYACGDDDKRIAFDRESRLKPKQIMFSAKGDREAGEWTRDRDELLDEYREHAPPAYLRRLLRLAYPVIDSLDVDLSRTVPQVLRS